MKQLKTDHSVFPYETRAILIDDALNLARMNLLDYKIAFDLLSYLMDKDEVTLHPWLSALNNLNYLYKTMEELPNFAVVENFMRDIVNAGELINYFKHCEVIFDHLNACSIQQN